MAKVWFRCDGKNSKMFILQSLKEIDNIPIIGDLIDPFVDDFRIASFRVKPFRAESFKNFTHIKFKVVSREFNLRTERWELICEPTAESLLFLLKHIKVK